MPRDNFDGIIPLEEFLRKFLPPNSSEVAEIPEIVGHSADALEEAKEAASSQIEAFIAYLRRIVSQLPAEKRPFIGDTRKTVFNSLDQDEDYEMPDITCSRPGLQTSPKGWPEVGTVFELKHPDTFNEKGEMIEFAHQTHFQLAKTALSLLMASKACSVYVVSIFRHGMARIFRFDRSSFSATSAFDWATEAHALPTFFYRLYNVEGPDVRMHGDDDTISIPTLNEKFTMYGALRRHGFYNAIYNSQEAATKDSLWMKAVRFENVDGNRVSRIVRCFTFGAPLSDSTGLFSRATRVHRVILEEDAALQDPPIYVLKDVWRDARRRPEIDFYDTIAKYCQLNGHKMVGMARCHGSVDLSVSTQPPPPWDMALHSTRTNKNIVERCHTRSLLTPVGKPLKYFPSTKAMVQALHSAVYTLRSR